MSIHLIVTEAEQLAIVNALAFYNYKHTNALWDTDHDEMEQWRLAFAEDNRNGWDWQGPVDKLATKIANTK